MSFGYFIDNHVSLLKEEPFRLQYFIENVERRPCRASHPLISWRRRIQVENFILLKKKQSIYEDIFSFSASSLRGDVFVINRRLIKRSINSPSTEISTPCYSANETPANVMPRNIFLLHFKESHPIHQPRKKCGNYWGKFMGPQGAGDVAALIINKCELSDEKINRCVVRLKHHVWSDVSPEELFVWKSLAT